MWGGTGEKEERAIVVKYFVLDKAKLQLKDPRRQWF